VALKAELNYLAALEHSIIDRPVRDMALHTAFNLRRPMLEGEGAPLVGMALQASCLVPA